MSRDVLNGRQQVVLHPHEQLPLLPRVLQIQRPKVIPQTPLPAPDDGHETEVSEAIVLVDRALPALEDDGHVELLDDKVDHLSGRCLVVHVQLHRSPAGQARLVGGINLGIGGKIKSSFYRKSILKTVQKTLAKAMHNIHCKLCNWKQSVSELNYYSRDCIIRIAPCLF